MQIFPNVYQIKSVFGNRYIYQYLFVGDAAILLDAGVADTPVTTIYPYLEKLGISPRQISMVIALHADVDHHGGLPGMKDVSPGTLLVCHQGDRKLIEDPEFLYQERYNFLAQDHGLGFGREAMAHCPEGRKIDVVLSANERLQLSEDWHLQVWHVPGHSAGHLAIYDEKHHAAFTSDAVQAGGYPTIDDQLAFGPTYYAVESYLATIQFLENMPIEHLFSGHWPGMHDGEVARFLESSRSFVNTADALLLSYFRTHNGGVTLRQLLADLSPKLGSWPEDASSVLQFALFGHLVRMKQKGVILEDKSQPVQWKLA
jgi:glyoxylase-like metal-dependent hydrolase (beta-lactamase superfamily II)